MDIYERFFLKLSTKGFPNEFKGYKVKYYFKNYQADIKMFPTVKKIAKMWELLSE